MLKDYIVNGLQFQFEEGHQPQGAVEVKTEGELPETAKEPARKAAKPANKARAVKGK